jgi:hypothetical protein
VTSYVDTKPTIAIAVTSACRQNDLEIITLQL